MEYQRKDILSRAELLLGDAVMQRLASTRVIVFGVGGVGSWCVEALVRSGVGHVTIVDGDTVNVTNINRQLPATVDTVGMAKVEAMCRHLKQVQPYADIRPVDGIYCQETAETFDLDTYDYVVDAIDSLKDKALLIINATRSRARLFSSMGAALKLDPSRIKIAEFYDVKGCPLARALRQRFKRFGTGPARKFKCVYSDELLANSGQDTATGDTEPALFYKPRTNGSLMHITATYGNFLAGLIISDVEKKARTANSPGK